VNITINIYVIELVFSAIDSQEVEDTFSGKKTHFDIFHIFGSRRCNSEDIRLMNIFCAYGYIL